MKPVLFLFQWLCSQFFLSSIDCAASSFSLPLTMQLVLSLFHWLCSQFFLSSIDYAASSFSLPLTMEPVLSLIHRLCSHSYRSNVRMKLQQHFYFDSYNDSLSSTDYIASSLPSTDYIASSLPSTDYAAIDNATKSLSSTDKPPALSLSIYNYMKLKWSSWILMLRRSRNFQGYTD